MNAVMLTMMRIGTRRMMTISNDDEHYENKADGLGFRVYEGGCEEMCFIRDSLPGMK